MATKVIEKRTYFQLQVIQLNSLSPHDALKHHFTSLKAGFIFLQTRGFRMKIYNTCMPIFSNFSPTARHLHPLQVENCDSNSRLVVDEDDNCKFRLENVKAAPWDDINFRF